MIQLGNGQIALGDCLDVMRSVPSASVDMVVTSPPYDNLRTYNNGLQWDFETVARELSRLIRDGGVIVWNVGDATVNGSETGTSFKQALFFKDVCGLNIHDTMIWNKPNVLPLTHNRYEQSFEYMFVFSKGKPKIFNPIKDKTNVGFGREITGTWRDSDGSVKPLNGKGKTIAQYGIRHNVWNMETAKGKKKSDHPASFPVQLPTDHIISWSNHGDIVLDPFLGSGTTAIAAENTGRRWIGIERDPTYFGAACDRIARHTNGVGK